jgi:hypothetical protein
LVETDEQDDGVFMALDRAPVRFELAGFGSHRAP